MCLDLQRYCTSPPTKQCVPECSTTQNMLEACIHGGCSTFLCHVVVLTSCFAHRTGRPASTRRNTREQAHPGRRSPGNGALELPPTEAAPGQTALRLLELPSQKPKPWPPKLLRVFGASGGGKLQVDEASFCNLVGGLHRGFDIPLFHGGPRQGSCSLVAKLRRVIKLAANRSCVSPCKQEPR